MKGPGSELVRVLLADLLQGANLLGTSKRLGTGELLQMENINVFLFSKMCTSIMAPRKQHFVVYWALTPDID